MTIGDEKVVAWRDVIVPSHASSDQLYNWNAEAVSRDEAESKIAALHSAYAELAADRDLWRSMATFEGKVSASVLDDLHTTQAQLAELRGRVLEIDALMRKDIAEFGGCLKLVNRLRALAAADGGGK